MSYRIIYPVLVLAVLVSASALQAQAVEAGSYMLVSVADDALPAVVDSSDDCQEELVSGTLTVSADSTWTLEAEVRETCGTEVETEQETEEGRYTVEGTETLFDEPEDANDDVDDAADDPEIDWDDLASGTLDGDMLMITLEDGETELMFER